MTLLDLAKVMGHASGFDLDRDSQYQVVDAFTQAHFRKTPNGDILLGGSAWPGDMDALNQGEVAYVEFTGTYELTISVYTN